MKLEVGMYVRDIHGQIDKIIGFKGSLIEFEKDLIVGYLDSNDFTKASFDILDLIEEGDLLEIQYLSRKYVERVTDLFKVIYSDEKCKIFSSSSRNFRIKNKEFSGRDQMVDPIIKRVLTKEQFGSVAYEIGGQN